MKVYIDEDERWPTYYLKTRRNYKHWSDYYAKSAIEMPDELYKRHRKAMQELDRAERAIEKWMEKNGYRL